MRRGVTGIVAVVGAAAVVAPFGAGTATAAAPTAVAGAASSAVPGCDATTIEAVGDLDGDAVAEIVVGLPDHSGGGAVDVRRTRGGGSVITPATVGLTGATDRSQFGRSVLVTELNGDRCADLVIGAPGHGAAGVVVIALGDPTGWSAANATTVAAPTQKAGSQFGWALAQGTDGTGPSAVPFIAVGMPGYPLASRLDSGAVVKFPVPGGVPGPLLTATEDTPGVAGTSAGGTRFGEVLATTNGSTILVGIWRDVVNGFYNAGSVTLLQHHAGAWAGVNVNENSPGIPGVAEQADRFGWSVVGLSVLPTDGGGDVQFSVGVPGEDIGRVTAAGSVVSVRKSSSSTRAVLLHQSGAWEGLPVPDVDEYFDAFGSSLATASLDRETQALVVGVPGEKVGTIEKAGQLVLFDVGPEMSGTMSVLTEASPLFRGYVEKRDGFGSTLASGRYETPDQANGTRSRLLVGITGETVRSATSAGAVAWSDNRERGGIVTFSQGERERLFYGSVLGTPAG